MRRKDQSELLEGSNGALNLKYVASNKKELFNTFSLTLAVFCLRAKIQTLAFTLVHVIGHAGGT